MPDTSQPTVERHINWGGVLKGAAIVVGVIAVAAVGLWAATLLSTYVTGALAANATASALASGAAGGAQVAGAHAAWLGGSAIHLVSGIPAGLVKILGLTGHTLAPAALGTVNTAVGIAGAATAGLVATHAALPYLQHGHYVDVDSSVHTQEGVLATTTVPMHDLAHMTHHAAEHADEHNAAWTQRVAPPRVTSYTTFADKVNAAKEERKTAAPAANFTEQLNADRANLDAALAK
jgi:hypothetical protein